MLRQIFIIVSLYVISGAAVASEETRVEERKNTFTASPLQFGLDLEYYTPSYKNYVYAQNNAATSLGTTSVIGKGAQVSLEWLPLGNKIGKLGVGLASGFAVITDSTVTVESVVRSVNLYVIPTQAFLSYHLDFFQNQIIVPFAKIGASASWLRQTVDGAESYNMAYGLDYSFGGEFCLNAIEAKAGREFDSRFGVNGTYLIAEYLKSSQLSSTNPVNLAYDAIRFGMRFEF